MGNVDAFAGGKCERLGVQIYRPAAGAGRKIKVVCRDVGVYIIFDGCAGGYRRVVIVGPDALAFDDQGRCRYLAGRHCQIELRLSYGRRSVDIGVYDDARADGRHAGAVDGYVSAQGCGVVVGAVSDQEVASGIGGHKQIVARDLQVTRDYYLTRALACQRQVDVGITP